jgi:hypothetical protein
VNGSLAVSAPGSKALPLWLVVASPIQTFSINADTSIPKPVTVSYARPPQVGTDLSGVGVVQGYSSVQWQYPLLADHDIALLMGHYHPDSPQVTLTFPDEFGSWVQLAGMMQPPSLGSRSTIVHNGVSLTFTHLS